MYINFMLQKVCLLSLHLICVLARHINLSLFFLWGLYRHWFAAFRELLVDFYVSEYTYPETDQKRQLRNLSKRNANVYPPNTAMWKVHGSFTSTSPRVVITKCVTAGWRNQSWCFYSTEYSYIIKRNNSAICTSTCMNFKRRLT